MIVEVVASCLPSELTRLESRVVDACTQLWGTGHLKFTTPCLSDNDKTCAYDLINSSTALVYFGP